MENPYKIKPGEDLTLDLVFDRYLDWWHWNGEFNRSRRSKKCDQMLHQAHLCCEDHMAMTSENHAFFVYFFHRTYDEAIHNQDGFSMNSMQRFIKDHRIIVLAEKAGRYHGLSKKQWETFATTGSYK